MKPPLAIALLFVTTFSAGALSAELTTLTGATYHDVKVTGVDPDGLRITHQFGVTKVPFEQLPEALRTQYHYDKQKAEAYRLQTSERQKQAAAELQRKSQEDEQSRKWIANQVEQQKQNLAAEKVMREREQTNARIVDWLLFLGAWLVVALLYFVPTFVGLRKQNARAIFVLNLFLGWTFVGWVVALVWACTKEPMPQ